MKETPERRNEILLAKKRIQSATSFFETNFYNDGRPKTKKGKRLYERYYVPEYGERTRSPFRPIWKLKMFIRKIIRRIWRWIDPPICGHCDELVEDMVIGVSINYLSNTWYHYSCYKEVYHLPNK